MQEASDTLDRLAQEYLRRLRAGESVTPEAYTADHPELAERIREVFPVLALLEGLKPPPAPSSSEAGDPEDDTTSAPHPTHVGPYSVVRELGRGGMGRVYEVSDAAGRRHALKVVHPHLLERSGFLARFLREIETGQRIAHANVVRTAASGVAELEGSEVPYVLLEYVEGDTLRDLLDETGGVSERLAREIGVAMAEALAAIHEAGIVHRDVKPENVILTPDESIKLMDLGVALVHEEALRLTQTGEFVGSLLYAAPEQLRQGHVDARADLYALGLVLYELVAGLHPEAAGEGPVLAQKLTARRARPLRDVVPSATPFFERVLDRLLVAEPGRRLGDAGAVARILAEGEAGTWWQEERDRSGAHGRPRPVADSVALAGRETELAVLDTLWAEAREGRGRVCIVRGEAGIGKSRLLSAWLDRLDSLLVAPAVLWIEHAPASESVGLVLLARELRTQLGEDPLGRVQGWLGDRADRAADVLAALEDAAGGFLDRDMGSAALETMMLQLLRGLAAERPVVLVTEDLHLATDEGRALFRRLAYAFGEHAVFVLGTTRPVEGVLPDESLGRLAHLQTLELAPLDEEAAFQVLRAGLGPALQPADAVRALVRLSDGNPYCLLEFARDVRTRAHEGSGTGQDLVLPRSVRNLVEARLRSLDSEDRELLATAACCGHRFDPVVVCEAADVPRIAGLRRLHRLERERGLIVAEGTEYRFHHHLVQEALHDELPPALRAAFHTALGVACERRLPQGTTSTGAPAFAVARHFLLGEEPARARPYVLAGLDYLIALAEGRRAVQMARAALKAFPDASVDLRAGLLFHLGRALDGNAPPSEIVAVLEQALEAARATEDRTLQLDTLQHLGAAVSHTGRHADAAGISAMAVDLAGRVDDALRQARALTSHATSLYNMGDHDAAFAQGHRALDLARAAGAAGQAGQTATILAAIYLEAGRLDDARPLAELALSVTHLHGDRAAEQYVSSVLAKLSHLQGDVTGARRLLGRSQRLAREMGNLRVAIGADIGMTHVLLNLGRVREALEGADHAISACESMGYVEIAALLALPQVLAASALGELGVAWSAAQRGQTLLTKVPLPAIVARVLPVVVQGLTWLGGFEEAENVLARGLAAAEQAGVPRERAQLHQAEAGLLDARDRVQEAAGRYAEVLQEVRTLKLDLHVALVAQRLAGLEVRLGREPSARSHLEEALTIAERGELPAVVAECGLWLDLLPGGSLKRARIALERDAHVLPARARLRLGLELSRRTEHPEDAALARALGETLVASAPEAWRERMRSNVALYREALA